MRAGRAGALAYACCSLYAHYRLGQDESPACVFCAGPAGVAGLPSSTLHANSFLPIVARLTPPSRAAAEVFQVVGLRAD